MRLITGILCSCSFIAVLAAYEERERVQLTASRVGPLANPTEAYRASSLPICLGIPGDEELDLIEDGLSGRRDESTPIDLRFRVNEEWQLLCEHTYKDKELKRIKDAIFEEYYWELRVDDMPAWGFVGQVINSLPGLTTLSSTDPGSTYRLYNHIHFDIGYNDGEVVDVNVTASADRDSPSFDELATEVHVRFGYSVDWVKSPVLLENRMSKYDTMSVHGPDMDVQWLTIGNSVLLIVILMLFTGSVLVRAVRNEWTAAVADELIEEFGSSGSGWKRIAGDVFRAPENWGLLAAAYGAGIQLAVTGAAVLFLCMVQRFGYTQRGTVAMTTVLVYVGSAAVGGYESARIYRQFGGKRWVWNIVLAGTLFPMPCFLTFVVLNTTAIAHDSIAALPAGTIALLLALFIVLALPLAIVGGIAGHNRQPWALPTRVASVIRALPGMPLYTRRWVTIPICASLSFTSVAMELHYIFLSLWSHRMYTMFGLLAVVYVLLAVITAFLAVAHAWVAVSQQRHDWWWRVWMGGAAMGVGVFLYGCLFWANHSDMRGFLQASFFFGSTAMFSLAVALAMGAVALAAALRFNRFLYSALKPE